jgi:hypothetical protein
VQVNDEDGQLQGMMLPRHIDSLKGGGTLQQNVAMSSLARLVSIMGSLLGITLPFQLEFLPTHCLIQVTLSLSLSLSFPHSFLCACTQLALCSSAAPQQRLARHIALFHAVAS